MRRFAFLLVLFVAAFCGAPRSEPPPVVRDGILDLRTWDFEKQGPIRLEGHWFFYWKRFVSPQEFGEGPPAPDGYIESPRNWNSFRIDQGENEIGPMGWGTYGIRILLPPTDQLSLKVYSLASAYDLYVNGRRIDGRGVISSDPSKYHPQKNPQIYRLKSEGPELTLLFQVSNFVDAFGGMWGPVTLGESAQIESLERNLLASDLFLCGSLLIMGLYHLGLFYYRPKEKAALFLGLVCPLVATRTLVTGAGYLYQVFPDFPYEWGVRLEYITFYLGGPLFVMYLRSLFPDEFHRFVQRVYMAVGIALSLFVIITPLYLFGRTLLPMQLVTLVACIFAIVAIILAIYRRRPGSFSFAFGVIAFAITIGHDILGYYVNIGPGTWAPFGLFLFLFAQAFLLSTRFASAFARVEDLTYNLEQKVELRTRQLSSALQTIQEDIQHAKAVQTNTLPIGSGPWPGLEIHPEYLPMTEIGGDYYDIRRLENGNVRVFLADATGHGIQAALMTMSIYAEYIGLRDELIPPGEILTKLNNQYCDRYSLLNSLFTCFLMDIDLEKNTITYSSAGHPQQIVIGSGSSRKLYVQNRLIGVLNNYQYDQAEEDFRPGERIVLFTDGIFEEFDDSAEEFGEDKLQEIALAGVSLSAEEFCSQTIEAVRRFSSNQSFTDDVTLIAIDHKLDDVGAAVRESKQTT